MTSVLIVGTYLDGRGWSPPGPCMALLRFGDSARVAGNSCTVACRDEAACLLAEQSLDHRPPSSLCPVPKLNPASCRPTMKLTSLACGLVALFAGHASATALTYKLVANEKACFYANNQDKGQKIAFYFAVRPTPECHFLSKAPY